MSFPSDSDFEAIFEWATSILVSWLQKKFGCKIQDAEDAAQVALQVAWEKRGEFRGQSDGQFRKWLLTIARNSLLSSFRKSNRMPTLTSDEWAARAAVADDRDTNDQLLNDVREAMTKLPPELRELLNQYFIEGLTMQQIADRLNISVGTVCTRLHRALRQIRESLLR